MPIFQGSIMEGIMLGKQEFTNIVLWSYNSWERQACKHVPVIHQRMKYVHQEQKALAMRSKVDSF